nr:MAG TPA: hypothetical protein [Caudoviricetes sp.]
MYVLLFPVFSSPLLLVYLIPCTYLFNISILGCI